MSFFEGLFGLYPAIKASMLSANRRIKKRIVLFNSFLINLFFKSRLIENQRESTNPFCSTSNTQTVQELQISIYRLPIVTYIFIGEIVCEL